jgi:hypothetical protein
MNVRRLQTSVLEVFGLRSGQRVIFRAIMVQMFPPIVGHAFSPKLVHRFSPKMVHSFSTKLVQGDNGETPSPEAYTRFWY